METTPTTEVKGRKPQVRPRVMQALTLMVERGMKIPEAAETAGMQYESLRLALKRPHVQEALTRVKRAWLTSESFVAWNTVADLQRNAASEDVRLKSARTVLAAVGELEPDDGRMVIGGHGGVQIVITQAVQHITASDSGVFELPAFTMAESR